MHKLWNSFLEINESIKKNHTSSFAASTAFFLFLSLVPMLILLCTIIPYTPLTEELLLESVLQLFPKSFEPFLIVIVTEVYEKSAGVLSIAAFVTIWSAGKGMLALMRGLNEIHDTEEKRGYFFVRFISSFYTVVLLTVIVLALLLNVFGKVIFNFLATSFLPIEDVGRFFLRFRFLAVCMVMAILFSALYAYVPDKKLKFSEQVPGAFFTSVMWSVLSWGFSEYVGIGGGNIYGSLSIIVLIMLFLYFCMYTVLVGAQINKYLHEERKR